MNGHADQDGLDRAEARLRAAVAHRTATLPVDGEEAALAAVERRLPAARRLRSVGRPAAGVLAVAAVVAVVAGLAALVGNGGEDRQVEATDASTTTTPATTTTTAAPEPEPELADDAVWPPPGRQPYAAPLDVARSFVEEYLGFPDPPLSAFRPGGGPDEPTGEVDVHLVGEGGVVIDDRVVGTLLLRRDAGGWVVTGARSADIVVERPRPLDTLGATLVAEGRSRGYEGTIVVSVVERGATAARPLARAAGIGGVYEPEPFRLDVVLEARPSSPAGSVLFAADTGCGECNAAFAVVPVRLGAAADPPTRSRQP